MEYSQIISEASFPKHAPDSSYFAYSTNTTLYIKQSSTQLKNISILNTNSPIKGFQISPNSKYIAVYLSKKFAILIYHYDDLSKEIAKIQDSQHGIQSFFWAQDSLQLLVFSQYMYKVSIYNFSTNAVANIKGPKLSSNKGCAFNSNGKFMALIEKHDCKDYLSIYYTVDWKIVNVYSLDLFDAVEVKWAPNDSNLIVWDNCVNYKLLVFSHATGLVKKYEPYNYALGIRAVQFSHNALFLAIGSFDQKIRLLNALTWQEIAEFDCSNPVLNKDKKIIYKEDESGNGTKKMKVIESNNYKIPTIKVISSEDKPPNQGICLVQFSRDDRFIACKNENMPYTVFIWDISKLQLISIISCCSQIKSFKWSTQNNILSVISGNDKILVWRDNQTIAQCTFAFQNNKFSIQKMIWSQDGRRILISNKNDIVYVELTSQFLE